MKDTRPAALGLKRFPAKWRPVRVKKTRQIKNQGSDSIGTEKGLDVDVRGLESMISDGFVCLDLVELPVPGFLVDGSNEAMGRAVFLQPFVDGITVAAGHPDVEGDAVLMLRWSPAVPPC